MTWKKKVKNLVKRIRPVSYYKYQKDIQNILKLMKAHQDFFLVVKSDVSKLAKVIQEAQTEEAATKPQGKSKNDRMFG